MIARSEPDRDGVCRPLFRDAQMRAVGNDGHVAASLITRSGFRCAQFESR